MRNTGYGLQAAVNITDAELMSLCKTLEHKEAQMRHIHLILGPEP